MKYSHGSPKLLQRVFVGIKVTDEIAEACAKMQKELNDLPMRFISPEDIHLTLLSPWQMADQSFVEERLRQALHPIKRFSLKLERLSYGPNRTRLRLAWIQCKASEELIKLKKSLIKEFKTIEHLPFSPHITIARFSDKDRNLIRRHPINRQIRLSMPVKSVELFASIHQKGVVYRILASIQIPC